MADDLVSKLRKFVNEQHGGPLPIAILNDIWDGASELEKLRGFFAGWQPIASAPKGSPSLGYASEWFLAYGNKYQGPNGGKIAVIRRVFGNGYGPWECTGDANYKDDFFSHWMPLPPAPAAEKTLTQLLQAMPVIGVLNIDNPHDPKNKELKL